MSLGRSCRCTPLLNGMDRARPTAALLPIWRGSLSARATNASENEIHSTWYDRHHSGSPWRMDVRHRLAANVKKLRKERGWSQEALADEAGLDRTYVSGIERVVRNPTVTVVERVAV